ncbi:MAG: hypothetical protein ACI4ET_05080 [Bilifractor sp.]
MAAYDILQKEMQKEDEQKIQADTIGDAVALFGDDYCAVCCSEHYFAASYE